MSSSPLPPDSPSATNASSDVVLEEHDDRPRPSKEERANAMHRSRTAAAVRVTTARPGTFAAVLGEDASARDGNGAEGGREGGEGGPASAGNPDGNGAKSPNRSRNRRAAAAAAVRGSETPKFSPARTSTSSSQVGPAWEAPESSPVSSVVMAGGFGSGGGGAVLSGSGGGGVGGGSWGTPGMGTGSGSGGSSARRRRGRNTPSSTELEGRRKARARARGSSVSETDRSDPSFAQPPPTKIRRAGRTQADAPTGTLDGSGTLHRVKYAFKEHKKNQVRKAFHELDVLMGAVHEVTEAYVDAQGSGLRAAETRAVMARFLGEVAKDCDLINARLKDRKVLSTGVVQTRKERRDMTVKLVKARRERRAVAEAIEAERATQALGDAEVTHLQELDAFVAAVEATRAKAAEAIEASDAPATKGGKKKQKKKKGAAAETTRAATADDYALPVNAPALSVRLGSSARVLDAVRRSNAALQGAVKAIDAMVGEA